VLRTELIRLRIALSVAIELSRLHHSELLRFPLRMTNRTYVRV